MKETDLRVKSREKCNKYQLIDIAIISRLDFEFDQSSCCGVEKIFTSLLADQLEERGYCRDSFIVSWLSSFITQNATFKCFRKFSSLDCYITHALAIDEFVI